MGFISNSDEVGCLLEMIDTCPNDINYETALTMAKFADQNKNIENG